MREVKTIKKTFEEALAAFIAEARKHDLIEGVLVSGSYVNGRLGPYSDLDIYVLLAGTDSPAESWRAQVVGGVEMEVTQDTFEGYSKGLNEGQRVREEIHPLSTGTIIFDKQGQLARLKERASEVIEELSARSEPDMQAKEATARPLVFALRKIGNAHCRGDWITFESQCGFILHLLPGLVLTMSGRKVTPQPIQSFEQEFPQFYARWTRCLAAKDRDEKWRELKELIGEILSTFSIDKMPRRVPSLTCGSS